MEKKKPTLTDIRFKIVIAMLNHDEELYNRVKVYMT